MKISKRQQKLNRKKWIRALRSGKYKQGIGYLCNVSDPKKPEYCCLGVLCDALKVPYKDAYGARFYGTCSSNDENILDNRNIRKLVGLRKPRGDFRNETLTSINDNGFSFKKIAKIIESEPEGLFEE